MRKTRLIGLQILLLALAVLAVTAERCLGATFNLRAAQTTLTMPDGLVVTVWGYGLDNGPVTVPGPVLEVPPGDTELIINLTNELPVPTSLVIPGLSLPTNNAGPVWTDFPAETQAWAGARPAGNYTARVRSFVHEAPAKGGGAPGTATYVWNNMKPGTYLYQTGTTPSSQMQMGLYGALKQDAAAGPPYQAYGLTTEFDKELILVFSAIDPAMTEAISGGNFGAGRLVTNTKDYASRYFLVNGRAWPDKSLARANSCTPLLANDRILLRLLNASFETLVPILQGPYLSIRAEDGHLYPYFKDQYSVELAAGKTFDAWVQPPADGTYVLFDRRLHLTNAGADTPGGMIVHLVVGAPGAADTEGPLVTAADAVPNPAAGPTAATLVATADETGTGCSNIAGGEWWTGADPGLGSGTPVAPADGAFDSPLEALTASIDTAGLQVGVTTISVRARDAQGNWGAVATFLLKDVVTITSAVQVRNTIRLTATSSSANKVIMSVQGNAGAKLRYRKRTNDYRGVVRRVKVKPDSVTVTSSGGGSDTKPVPYP
jgi:FtsP/CotA-like multicopper oxidase with cupredoxin domain